MKLKNGTTANRMLANVGTKSKTVLISLMKSTLTRFYGLGKAKAKESDAKAKVKVNESSDFLMTKAKTKAKAIAKVMARTATPRAPTSLAKKVQARNLGVPQRKAEKIPVAADAAADFTRTQSVHFSKASQA